MKRFGSIQSRLRGNIAMSTTGVGEKEKKRKHCMPRSRSISDAINEDVDAARGGGCMNGLGSPFKKRWQAR